MMALRQSVESVVRLRKTVPTSWMTTGSLLAWSAIFLAPPAYSATPPWNAVPKPPLVATAAPRILLIYDMEGLSGQDGIDDTVPANPAYPAGQRLLTDDVNAVVAGLFQGGAGSVTVVDGHGSSSQIDILVDQLDPRAKMVARDETSENASTYDAIAIVGMHAGSGSGGFAAHTWTAGVEFKINGYALNEAELIGLTHGEQGLPVIFVSGDDRLGTELRSMPWIEYVTIKQATGVRSAVLVPLPEARRRLTLGAQQSLRRLPNARLMQVSQPVRASVTAFAPADLQWLAAVPGIRYQDQTVSFDATDARTAYRGMEAIGGAAMRGYGDALYRAIKSSPDARSIELRAIAEWDAKWVASERELARQRGNDKYQASR